MRLDARRSFSRKLFTIWHAQADRDARHAVVRLGWCGVCVCAGVCVCVCCVRVCVCVGVCGCVGVWVCGCVGVCVCMLHTILLLPCPFRVHLSPPPACAAFVSWANPSHLPPVEMVSRIVVRHDLVRSNSFNRFSLFLSLSLSLSLFLLSLSLSPLHDTNGLLV